MAEPALACPGSSPTVRASITRQGWATLSAVSGAFFVVVGVCAVSVGLLMTPLMAEFHWPNSTTSGLATVYSLSALLASPLAGLIIDRFGERPALVWGMATTSAGFLAVGCSHTLPAFYAAFLVIGVGYGAVFFLAATTLIARRMGMHKDFAMGVVFGAGAIGASVFAMLITWCIATIAWRITSIAMAILILATIPFILVFVSKTGLSAAAASDSGAAVARHAAPAKLLLTPFFLVLTLATTFAAFGMGGINFHVVPILIKAGYSSGLASAAYGSSWLLSGLGSLLAGLVAGRVGTGSVFAFCLLLGGAGTLLLMFVGDAPFGALWLWLFVLFWGLTANALNQFVPLIFMERFGPAHLASLVGVQSALMGLVSSFAPMATGALYDVFSDYRAAILASTITTFLGFVLAIGCNRFSIGLLETEARKGALP